MAHSLIHYTTDGVQRDYTVPFTSIKKDYVKAYLHELDSQGRVVGDRIPVEYTWLNNGLIRLASTPPAGSRLSIERETYADAPLVNFQDAALLTEEDLNLSAQQALHVAQEARDRNNYEIVEASRYVYTAVDEIKGHADRAEQALADAIENIEEAEQNASKTVNVMHDVAEQAKQHAKDAAKAAAEAEAITGIDLSQYVRTEFFKEELIKKSDTNHSHAISEVSGLNSALAEKAIKNHIHTTDQVTGLEGTLAEKAPKIHTHTTNQVAGLDAALSSKAAESHSHSINQVTDLEAVLAEKAVVTYGTQDLVPGTSPLPTGSIHLVYE